MTNVTEIKTTPNKISRKGGHTHNKIPVNSI